MGLRLSEKHGVNPSLEQCFVCMKDVGVVLFGKLTERDERKQIVRRDVEAPRRMCLSYEPCDECKKHMRSGVVLISVDETKSDDMKNPWRSGGWVVVSDEFIERVLQPGTATAVLKKRMAFVPDDAWDMLGLPRGEK